MKFKRPLSSTDVQLVIAGVLISVFLLPYAFKLTTARWMENRRLRTASTYNFPTPELAELDRVLQARFAEVPTNDFGMGRIGPRHEIFKPITPSERQAIDALRRQKMEVVFYVAGRNYLSDWLTSGAYKAHLQGPVYMTQKPPLKVKASQTLKTFDWGWSSFEQPRFQTEKRPIDLPTEKQLRRPLGSMLISSSKLDHTATSDGQTYRAGSWQVVAVPVRATDQSCINCHFRFSTPKNKPRRGDPLGISLYAYRPSTNR